MEKDSDTFLLQEVFGPHPPGQEWEIGFIFYGKSTALSFILKESLRLRLSPHWGLVSVQAPGGIVSALGPKELRMLPICSKTHGSTPTTMMQCADKPRVAELYQEQEGVRKGSGIWHPGMHLLRPDSWNLHFLIWKEGQ